MIDETSGDATDGQKREGRKAIVNSCSNRSKNRGESAVSREVGSGLFQHSTRINKEGPPGTARRSL